MGNQERNNRIKQLKQAYEGLYNEVFNILRDHDPIGIGYLPDEYEPELGTILPRLKEAQSSEDLTAVVHAEFVRWFDADIAGPRSRYTAIAKEIWIVYQRFLQATNQNATD